MLSKPEKLGKLSNCPKSGNPAKTSSKDVGWRRITGSGVSSPDCDVMRESSGGGGRGLPCCGRGEARTGEMERLHGSGAAGWLRNLTGHSLSVGPAPRQGWQPLQSISRNLNSPVESQQYKLQSPYFTPHSRMQASKVFNTPITLAVNLLIEPVFFFSIIPSIMSSSKTSQRSGIFYDLPYPVPTFYRMSDHAFDLKCLETEVQLAVM